MILLKICVIIILCRSCTFPPLGGIKRPSSQVGFFLLAFLPHMINSNCVQSIKGKKTVKALENMILVKDYLADQVDAGLTIVQAKVKLSNDLNVGFQTIYRWEKSTEHFIIEDATGIVAFQRVSKNHEVRK